MSFDYTGPEAWRSGIAQALGEIVDPELGVAITDLGLLRRIDIDDTHCRVQMTMTSAACPSADLLADDVHGVLDELLPLGTQIDVSVVWEPPWSPEQMSDAARRTLRW